MNPLKKLKLKSQLRNCDYVLAGTVIKQQYYDESKSTVINRLIDEFMANPGFDTALKLIEYNEMMVFYFTESCAGGLYVRKTSQSEAARRIPVSQDTGPLPKPRDLDERLQTHGSASSPANDVHDTGTLDVHTSHETSEAKPSVEKSPEQVFQDWESDRRRRMLEESEAWMEEMISRISSNKEPEEMSSRYRFDDDTGQLDDTLDITGRLARIRDEEWDDMETKQVPIIDESLTSEAASETAAEEETAAAADHGWARHAESYIPAKEHEWSDPVPATGSIDPAETSRLHQGADPYAPNSPHPVQQAQPAQSAHPHLPMTPARQRGYANVIATLKIDIHTMVKQLEEYRRELSSQPFNEKQLIAWINSLEEAIEEFSEVVDMLEDMK